MTYRVANNPGDEVGLFADGQPVPEVNTYLASLRRSGKALNTIRTVAYVLKGLYERSEAVDVSPATAESFLSDVIWHAAIPLSTSSVSRDSIKQPARSAMMRRRRYAAMDIWDFKTFLDEHLPGCPGIIPNILRRTAKSPQDLFVDTLYTHIKDWASNAASIPSTSLNRYLKSDASTDVVAALSQVVETGRDIVLLDFLAVLRLTPSQCIECRVGDIDWNEGTLRVASRFHGPDRSVSLLVPGFPRRGITTTVFKHVGQLVFSDGSPEAAARPILTSSLRAHPGSQLTYQGVATIIRSLGNKARIVLTVGSIRRRDLQHWTAIPLPAHAPHSHTLHSGADTFQCEPSAWSDYSPDTALLELRALIELLPFTQERSNAVKVCDFAARHPGSRTRRRILDLLRRLDAYAKYDTELSSSGARKRAHWHESPGMRMAVQIVTGRPLDLVARGRELAEFLEFSL